MSGDGKGDMDDAEVKNIEVNLHLKWSMRIICYLGTWAPSGKYRILYNVVSLCSYVLVVGSFIVFQSVKLILVWGDTSKIITGLTMLVTCYVHALKVCLFVPQQKRIQALLDATKWKVFSRDNVKYRHVVARYTWRGVLHYVIYQGMAFVGVSCWVITPILTKRNPVEIWFPLDTSTDQVFVLTAFHQILAIFYISWHSISIDILINGLVTVACCQLAILRRNIAAINHRLTGENAGSGNNGNNSGRSVLVDNRNQGEDYDRTMGVGSHSEDDELYEGLKKCVQHSHSIFEFAGMHQDIFSTLIFSQLTINCIIICFIAFQIAQVKEHAISTLAGLVLYASAITYQVFIYCWHGSELETHSTNVILAAYSNIWWAKTARFKSALQIIMTRMQRPFMFMAGNIMHLSLDTFLGIMKLSYSIFTMLLSINK